MRISDWSSDVCSSDLQGALRRGAGERHREHREEREVDLVDRRLLRVFRKLRLRQVDLLAHVEQRLVRIEAGIEFQYHVGAAEVGGRGHLLHALDRPQLLLQRLDDQALGVLRSAEHTSELQSLMRISYAVFCLKK